ncbi:MAG: hypothetical protein ABEJ80_04915 [Halarchaeum sp.]
MSDSVSRRTRLATGSLAVLGGLAVLAGAALGALAVVGGALLAVAGFRTGR